MDSIFGHDKVKTALRHAVHIGRLHHALLFSGPEGVGKTSLAIAFAESLLCERSTSEKIVHCHECDTCRRTATEWAELNEVPPIPEEISGLHVKSGLPDLFKIDEPSAQIKVATIRALSAKTSTALYCAKHRFVIVRDAHKMRDVAANAFLKTLEEPNPDTTFILTTSQIHGLLPTIVSRCQTVRFAAFSHHEVADWLVRNKNADNDEAERIAAMASGSIGNAVELLEGSLKDDIEAAFQKIILNTDSAMQALVNASALKGKKNIMLPLVRLLSVFLRDVLNTQVAPQTPPTLTQRIDAIRRCAASSRPADVMRALDNIQDIYSAVTYSNANEQLSWDRFMLGFQGVLFQA